MGKLHGCQAQIFWGHLTHTDRFYPDSAIAWYVQSIHERAILSKKYGTHCSGSGAVGHKIRSGFPMIAFFILAPLVRNGNVYDAYASY
jgi:hypothetical protein